MAGLEWMLEGWLPSALGFLGLLLVSAVTAAAGEARREGGRS